jgi:hypothetical protein
MSPEIQCVSESGAAHHRPLNVILLRDDLPAAARFFVAMGLKTVAQPTPMNVVLGCEGLQLQIRPANGKNAEPTQRRYFRVPDVTQAVAAVRTSGGVVVADGDSTPRSFLVHLLDGRGSRAVVAENSPKLSVAYQTPSTDNATRLSGSGYVSPTNSRTGALWVAVGFAMLCFPTWYMLRSLVFSLASWPQGVSLNRTAVQICYSFGVAAACACMTGRIWGRRNRRVRLRTALDVGYVLDALVFFTAFALYFPTRSAMLILAESASYVVGVFGGAASYLVCILASVTPAKNRVFRRAALGCLIALPMVLAAYALAFVIPYNYPAWRESRLLWRLMERGVNAWALLFIVVASWFHWALKNEQ